MRPFRHFIFALGIAFGGLAAARAEDPVGATGDPFQFFQEEAKVVTASRRPQPRSEAPVAVDVITTDDIKASGANTLWDLLRFRVGMDVYDDQGGGSAGRGVVSVRGSPGELVDNLLVLVDGRSTYDSVNANTSWATLPVQIQDIERIEIVRGPNAALYGSNAAQGVINIITKKPQDKESVSAMALGGNRGIQREETAVEQSGKSAGYRVSYTHQTEGDFDTVAGPRANDFLFSNKGNFRGYWNPREKSTLELFVGGLWNTVGNPLPSIPANTQENDRNHFEMLKWTQELASESTLQVQASHRDSVTDFTLPDLASGTASKVREYENAFEAVHRLGWLDSRMQSVYGVNYSYLTSESVQLFGAPEPQHNNRLTRGFVSNAWKLNNIFTFSGAVSEEGSDTGGIEPAYNLALVTHPSETQVVRVTHSLASTVPGLLQTSGDFFSQGVEIIGNPNLDPERVRSTEIGYEGSYLERKLLTEADVYYITTRNLISFGLVTPFPTVLTYVNNGESISRGSEVKLEYHFRPDRLIYTNYTYQSVTDDLGGTESLSAPAHKWNLGGRCALGDGWTASVNAGYKDAYTAFSSPSSAIIPAYWRLDARLAYAVNKNIELFMVGQNLTLANHREAADGLLVPRTFFGGASMKLGRS